MTSSSSSPPLYDDGDDFFGLKKLETLELPGRTGAAAATEVKHVNQKISATNRRQRRRRDGEQKQQQKTPPFIINEKGEEADFGDGDEFELQLGPGNTTSTGLFELRNLIDPVWKLNAEELVEFMAERVVYENDDFIALDKPYQMAYACAPEDQAQLDRILQPLKQRIAPQIDRLHVISPLDKPCSGIVLFAKNAEKQKHMRVLLDEGAFFFRFRCLCRGFPTNEKTRISIPLIKVLRGINVKFCPLNERADKRQRLFHLNTDCKLVNENRAANVSLIDAFSHKGMAQVVRSHLYYGLDCPVMGDPKYVRAHVGPAESVLSTKLQRQAMEALELRKNDTRKLPMFMHLAEIHVPEGTAKAAGKTAAATMAAEGGGGRNFSVVRSDLPRFFGYALKKLSLLRK